MYKKIKGWMKKQNSMSKKKQKTPEQNWNRNCRQYIVYTKSNKNKWPEDYARKICTTRTILHFGKHHPLTSKSMNMNQYLHMNQKKSLYKMKLWVSDSKTKWKEKWLQCVTHRSVCLPKHFALAKCIHFNVKPMG